MRGDVGLPVFYLWNLPHPQDGCLMLGNNISGRLRIRGWSPVKARDTQGL